jgi:hypothetical protein
MRDQRAARARARALLSGSAVRCPFRALDRLRLYRARFHLAEIAIYTHQFRQPQVGDLNDATAGDNFLVHLIVILLVIYVRHLFRNDRIRAEDRALWGVLLLLGNAIAMPISWYLYIWREPSNIRHTINRRSAGATLCSGWDLDMAGSVLDPASARGAFVAQRGHCEIQGEEYG